MDRFLTDEEEERLWAEKSKCKVTCKCGHVSTILNKEGYKLCAWCKNYVFRNKTIEFEYRMKEKLMREKRKKK